MPLDYLRPLHNLLLQAPEIPPWPDNRPSSALPNWSDPTTWQALPFLLNSKSGIGKTTRPLGACADQTEQWPPSPTTGKWGDKFSLWQSHSSRLIRPAFHLSETLEPATLSRAFPRLWSNSSENLSSPLLVPPHPLQYMGLIQTSFNCGGKRWGTRMLPPSFQNGFDKEHLSGSFNPSKPAMSSHQSLLWRPPIPKVSPFRVGRMGKLLVSRRRTTGGVGPPSRAGKERPLCFLR